MDDPAAAAGIAVALADLIARHPGASYAAGLVVVVAAAWSSVRSPGVPTSGDPAPSDAAQTRPAALRRALVVILVASTVFLLMTDGLGAGHSIGALDTALAASLAVGVPTALLEAFAAITHLADRQTLIGLTVVVALGLAWRRESRLAVGWTLGCAGNGLLNPALKHVFERARPPHDAAYATIGLSFPSGHTSGAVVCYGLLAYVLIRHAPSRWNGAIAAIAAALVFTIGTSRVLLRVHWASDVLAGLASGSAWLAVCVAVLEWRRAQAASRESRRPGLR